MDPSNRKAVTNMLTVLERYRLELNDMQDQEESELLDQALNDIELLIEDLYAAVM